MKVFSFTVLAFMVTAIFSVSACTSISGGSGEKSIEAIEDEKEPLKDSDCLEGEYFDKGTESCEPLESPSASENSHDGPIDVPK
jgi:hypothetical protein